MRVLPNLVALRMALKKCHECGHQVSTSAPACPSCGAKVKKGMGCGTLLLALFLSFIGMIVLLGALGIWSASARRSEEVNAAIDSKKAFEKSKREFENSISEKFRLLVEKKNANDVQGALKILREFETFKRADYDGVDALKTQILTAGALERLRTTAPTEINVIHGIFIELSRLNPENPEYAQQVSKYADAVKQAEIVRIAQESEARVKAQKERERNIKESTSSLVAHKDEVEGITWYKHKESPKSDASKAIFAYIGKKEGSLWLRMKITYTADDWLFIKNFTFNIDGTSYSLPISYFRDRKSDNSGGKIWEWVDLMVDAESFALLNKVSRSSRTILRYEGQQYYSDRVVSSSEKLIIQQILTAFSALGGLPPSR
ncbi:MAG: zinc ribbon domain-containing protein [Prosthecobacter sp.]